MKRLLAMVTVLAVCCLGQATKAENDVAVNVKVSLADGSQLQGTLHTSSLALVTGFGKKEIPLAQIASLDFAKDGVKVNFRNRDVLSGKLEGTAFVLRTIFSDVRLESAQVKSIQFFGDGNMPRGGNEPGLLLHARLDSDNENLGMFNAHMEAKNVRMIDGKFGRPAMLLDTADAKVTIHLPFAPYKMPEGTIEFWAMLPKPHQPFGGGKGQPWFFGIECPLSYFNNPVPGVNYNNHSIFGFAPNDGGGKGGLVGRLYGIANAGTHHFGSVSTVAETGLLGDTPEGWHHYAFIWKRDGFLLADGRNGVLLLSVNGKVVASTMTVGTDPHGLLENPKSEVYLVIHDSDSDCTRPVAMSELKVWDHAKLPTITID